MSSLAALLATRDASLALAAAALARVADPQGRATFNGLAIAYRDAFLRLRGHERGGVLPDAGSLSVDDARSYLESSVLPRLALLKVVSLPTGKLWNDAPVAFVPAGWEELVAMPPAADELFAAAEHAYARAEPTSGEHAAPSARSSLEAEGLVTS